jgi:hypothetical protein
LARPIIPAGDRGGPVFLNSDRLAVGPDTSKKNAGFGCLFSVGIERTPGLADNVHFWLAIWASVVGNVFLPSRIASGAKVDIVTCFQGLELTC